MTNDTDDFFGQMAQDTGMPGRDNYQRPMLIPRGEKDRKGYRRASSFADIVDSKIGIHKWEMRGLARAMAQADDMRLLAAGETYNTGFDMTDIGENKASGARLDSIIARALDRIGWSQKSDFGTAVHSFFDPANPNPVPEELKPFVDGYFERLANDGIEILSVEQFVACDEVMSAGTFDALVHHPDYGVVVGDGKTGKRSRGFVSQISIYNHAELYDIDTDRRAPIHADLNPKVGLVFDVKADGTNIYEVDTAKGWDITKALYLVHEDFNMKLMKKLPRRVGASIVDKIAQATTLDELNKVWEATSTGWTDREIQAAKARRLEIE
jgi:hypothetical protein